MLLDLDLLKLLLIEVILNPTNNVVKIQLGSNAILLMKTIDIFKYKNLHLAQGFYTTSTLTNAFDVVLEAKYEWDGDPGLQLKVFKFFIQN